MKQAKAKSYIHFIIQLLLSGLLLSSCFSQEPAAKGNLQTDSLIAVSQAGAMPIFFDPSDVYAPVISTADYKDSLECLVRGGIPNFFCKMHTVDSVTIGYIGGSITRGDNMYRNQSAEFIQQMYPGVRIKAINAGVSGTGTAMGACRIKEQLLKYHPDLVFIEFAVNGAFREGMEGMIRQILRFDPFIDICLLYTIREGQTTTYTQGGIPANIEGLEKIANYYHIPSIHMGLQASFLEKNKKLVWKNAATSADGRIVFSKDGIHPLKAGGNLYAAAIARSMIKMQAVNKRVRHLLPPPLLADNWEDARMLDPLKSAVFSKEWSSVKPEKIPLLKSFAPWFPYIMQACKSGASFSFRFSGNMVGMFDIGGPEAGQLLLNVDGQDVQLINRFNQYCNNRYRGQCEFIQLDKGIHTVRFTISPVKANKRKILGRNQQKDILSHPEKYGRTCEMLGKILIRGEIVRR